MASLPESSIYDRDGVLGRVFEQASAYINLWLPNSSRWVAWTSRLNIGALAASRCWGAGASEFY